MNKDAGLRLLGHLIRELAEGHTPVVAEIAAATGVARSTAFEVVSRMELAALVVRDRHGRLMPGRQMRALVFARRGLQGLCGPAEAILGWLCEQTGGHVRLECVSEVGVTTLLTAGSLPARRGIDAALVQPAIAISNGVTANIVVEFSAGATASRILAERNLAEAATALARHYEETKRGGN